MPSPVYEAGVYGNVMRDETLKAGGIVAAFLDLTSDIEGQLTVETITTATAPKRGPTFEVHKVVGLTRHISVAVPAGGTSVTMDTAAGLHLNENILLWQSAPPNLGEVVSVTSASTDGHTISITPTKNAYGVTDIVCKITQTPVTAIQPSASNGTWAPNSVYSTCIFNGTSAWALVATGNDVDVIVSSTMDKVTRYQ